MLVLTLLSLLLFMLGHRAWSVAAFGLALVSKETAAVLPLLVCAYLVIVNRQSVGQALRRTWPFWSVLVAWVILHPTLRVRMLGGFGSTPELEWRPPWHVIVLKSIAACFNLDRPPQPQEIEAPFLNSLAKYLNVPSIGAGRGRDLGPLAVSITAMHDGACPNPPFAR